MDSKGKNIVDFGAARKNLKRKKKDEARTLKKQRAAENRIRYGRTKVEKEFDKRRKEQNEQKQDGNKPQSPESPPSKEPNE